MQIFDSNITLLEKSIELRGKRNEVISSNIANRETPGFKAQDLVFEKQLEQAFYSKQTGPLKVTNARHFNGSDVSTVSSVQGQKIVSFNPETRYDDNSVDLDQEMAKLATNQIQFETSTRMISKKLMILKDSIIDSGR